MDLAPPELEHLQPYTQVQHYTQGEIVMQEGDRLPARLYALLSASLQVVKTATTGLEAIRQTPEIALRKHWRRSRLAHNN